MSSTHGCAYCTVCSTGVMDTLRSPHIHANSLSLSFLCYWNDRCGPVSPLNVWQDTRYHRQALWDFGVVPWLSSIFAFILLSVPIPSANNLSWVLSSCNNFLRPFPFQHSIRCSFSSVYHCRFQFALDSHRFERSRLKSACEVTDKADPARSSVLSRKPDTSGVTQIIVFFLSYIV